ncbi:hypothetical protein [Metabacillus malikii]|uniref:Uncharacterized protein n=1 Tax=Metabacillus malikii TaxID=1504265 RepID=A0ABT9ZDM3_9BACI|nr:hypothetical protein [Metabacillus malikii]MDQ0230115.1 hypothetical protein [Metabacillus malikii]
MRNRILFCFLLVMLIITGCGGKSQNEMDKQERKKAEQQEKKIEKENAQMQIHAAMITAFGNDGYEYLQARDELITIIGAKNVGFDLAFAGDKSEEQKLTQALQMAHDKESFAQHGLLLEAPSEMHDLYAETKRAFQLFSNGAASIIYGTENFDIDQVHSGYAEIDDGMRIIRNLNESHPVLLEYRKLQSMDVHERATEKRKQSKVVRPKHFNVYENERFNYRLAYPPTWPNGVESGNGDGMPLYEADGNHIFVYASNYDPASVYTPDLQAYTLITLYNGETAYYYEEDVSGIVTFEMVYLGMNSVQYTIHGEVDSDYFQENREIIMQVIRSFEDMTEGEGS